MDFYNFFSFSAKKAIFRNSEICAQFNNQELEPEHIFYSLLNLRSCSATQVLHALNVSLPKLTYTLEAHLFERAGTFKGSAGFSQRTIVILDLSYQEVRRLHHGEIGTTHLLIALAQENGAFLASLFEEHNVNAERIRETFITHLQGYSQEGSGDAGKVGREVRAAASTKHALRSAFLEEASRSFGMAAHVCQQFNHPQITPLHLLYGLLQLTRQDSHGMLKRLEIKEGPFLQATVDRLVVIPSPGTVLMNESPALLALATRAFSHALRLHSAGIANVHLLLALVEDKDPHVSTLCREHGLTIERVTLEIADWQRRTGVETRSHEPMLPQELLQDSRLDDIPEGNLEDHASAESLAEALGDEPISIDAFHDQSAESDAQGADRAGAEPGAAPDQEPDTDETAQ